MLHRDYLLRTVAQAAAALRRLREMLSERAQPDEVVRQARAAQGELLGRDAGLLRALDPASAAALLADPRRVALWAELLRVEAAAHRQAGRSAEAEPIEGRADALARLAGVPAPGTGNDAGNDAGNDDGT